MIKTIIIDDEQQVIDSLTYLLGRYCPDIEVCATADTFDDGYHLVKEHKPQLVFSDIVLNAAEGTGIDLIAILNKEDIQVIFISGFKDYAAAAFRVNAADYLLKPLSIQQLVEAVEKVKRRLNYTGSSGNAISAVIRIPTQQGFILIKQEDIIRCEAQGPYTCFHTRDKKITASINMGLLDTKLPGDIFFRVHKSYIVNKQHIVAYQRGDGGFVTMTDKADVPVSRKAKDSFLEWLDK